MVPFLLGATGRMQVRLKSDTLRPRLRTEGHSVKQRVGCSKKRLSLNRAALRRQGYKANRP